jgi:RNA methyltransferase, TrmH family
MKTESMLTELSKNHLAELLRLKQKKYRQQESRTLVEGFNLVEQLVHNGFMPDELITSSPELVFQLLKGKNCIAYHAKEFEIAKLTETETPQPLVGVFPIPNLRISKYQRLVYLDGIRDPGNLGTIFRTVAAFGWDGVALSNDCCEVFSPKVIRASLGSVFWIPSQTGDSKWLASQAALKIGLLTDGEIKLPDIKPEQGKPMILIIGSESTGISTEIRQELTLEAVIPISDKMESLNAAVAAGIAIYAISNRFYH